MVFKDARDYQILFLGTFLCLGIATRDWTLRVDLILVTIASCLLTQMLCAGVVSLNNESFNSLDFSRNFWQTKSFTPLNFSSILLPLASPLKKGGRGDCLLPFFTRISEFCKRSNLSLSSLRSALITALGLCLLLRANDYTTVILASCLAIASKFCFQFQEKHFFNPANFGIIIALIFTQDAWVSPGQWGADWWYLLLFLGTGGIVLNRVGRWDTSAAFLIAYGGLEAIRNMWLGWSWDVWQHHLMSGSLLLFALFMLTDPRSIPNANKSRLIWAIAIALLSFSLEHIFYLKTAIFWALFIVSPMTVLLDIWWNAPRFAWQENEIKKPSFS